MAVRPASFRCLTALPGWAVVQQMTMAAIRLSPAMRDPIHTLPHDGVALGFPRWSTSRWDLAAQHQAVLQLRTIERVDYSRGQNRKLRPLPAFWPPVFAGEQDVSPPKG